MPAVNDKYSNNEVQIYEALIEAGLNTAAACGVLANLYAESGLNPMNLQNSYESSLGYTDESYTYAVNNSTYMNFAKDSAGYGLAQWTYSARKKALYNYAKSKLVSIGNLSMQIEFLIMELQGGSGYSDFAEVWSMLEAIPNTPVGAYNAAYNFCRDFENPAGGESTYISRAETAVDTYWAHYNNEQLKETAAATKKIGKKIVEVARDVVAAGVEYVFGGNMYNNDGDGVDSPGLIYYCYNEAGYELEENTISGYLNDYKDKSKVIKKYEDLAPGDLIFVKFRLEGGDSLMVAIATGEDTMIYADPKNEKVLETTIVGMRTPDAMLRILSSVETEVPGSASFSPVTTDNYLSITSEDPTKLIVSSNLTKIESVGYDYGYLIDMTHGGEFKFHIPEFTESAGAQWEDIDIRGRSVKVKSYHTTNSRSVSISLELYAGVGLYTAVKGEETGFDTVTRMHKDANFIKSLEYPDYSNAITRPPSTVHLVLGSAFNLTGVVHDVNVEHMKPLDTQNRSMYLKVSFTVTQIAVNPPDFSDIRGAQVSSISTDNVDSLRTGDILLDASATNVPRW